MATTGISVEQLRRIHKMYPASELVDLSKLSAEHVPEAAVLVLRGGVGLLLDDPEGALKVRREVKSMPTDKEKLWEQTVIPCKSYYTNTIDDRDQMPDIPNGKGTTVNFAYYPIVQMLRQKIEELLEVLKLLGEINHYFDLKTCGISWHVRCVCPPSFRHRFHCADALRRVTWSERSLLAFVWETAIRCRSISSGSSIAAAWARWQGLS